MPRQFRNNRDQILPYMLFNPLLREYTETPQGFSRFDFYVPLLRFHGRMESIGYALQCGVFPSSDERLRRKGFRAMDRAWTTDLAMARAEHGPFNVEVDPATVSLFGRFLAECRDAGIEIVLVFSPEYYEGQGFVLNREELMSLYRGFASDYAIPFLNYSDDEICKNRVYFYNTTHMNSKGVAVFMEKLLRDLEEIFSST